MPELPEVETTVRALRAPLVGRTITAVSNNWPRQLATHDVDALNWQIRDQRVDAVNRRAKYLVFSLSGGDTLIIHLKMSGHLSVVDASQPPHKHVHTTFSLDNGTELRFRNMRKFGRVYLVTDPDSVLGGLGPEPLDDAFTPDGLRARLNGRSRAMKPLLLDQQFIAGVGNIYADEALFYARIHPRRTADSLTDSEIEALYTAIQKVLTMGIEREGASIDLYTKPDGTRGDMQNAVAVFRRTEFPCYQCQTPIERIVMNGRSTHFCPTCQK
jgi:formamidopyrimidine-DNA glycosylase